ncbi:MAG: radical SAM protein [Gammaproteobacteria bacterium]|nr:radical SAM protein [Gammaproteobacteria bacterium]
MMLPVTFLAKTVLVREEQELVYLYNRQNGAVLRIKSSDYQQLIANHGNDNPFFVQALSILAEQGMLAEDKFKSQMSKGDNAISGQHATIFGLQSTANPFTVLWALTACCNLNCSYCFPAANTVQPKHTALSYAELEQIATQLIAAKVMQITFSGGEALLEKNIWQIIAKLYPYNAKLVLITNGTVLTDAIIEHLRQYEIITAVSLDVHNEAINAKTRGANILAQTIEGIYKLKAAKIPLVILVTVTRFNFDVLYQHVKFIVEQLKIPHITLQDLRPFGTVDAYNNLRLHKEQEQKLPELIIKLKTDFPQVNFNFTELAIFPIMPNKTIKTGKIMQCPAGYNIAYIDFFGDLYPCTHLPSMKLGNLLHDGALTELWRNAEKMRRLRELKDKHLTILSHCQDCELQIYCDGGCRGDAIFYQQNLYGLASRCPLAMGISC